jgi:hypothetical protein
MKTGLILILIGIVLLLFLPPIGGLLIGLGIVIFVIGLFAKVLKLLAKGTLKGAAVLGRPVRGA